MNKIFVINTGSTSTKVALFEDATLSSQDNLVMPEERLKQSLTSLDQLPYRVEVVKNWLEKQHVTISSLDIIAARGGPLPPVEGGAYAVNQYMVDVLKYAPCSSHESALSCMIGMELSRGNNIPVIIYDAVSTDEMESIAKITGYPSIHNSSRSHPLNARQAAKIVAAKMGIHYCNGAFIVVHLGGSISVTAHKNGRIIDVSGAFNGPMSPQRCGRIPTDELVRLCFSGQFDRKTLSRKLNGGSGYKAYFGTQDARHISQLIESGDELAIAVTDAMVYQIAKAVAEMRIAIGENVDRIIITGGMAKFSYVTENLSKRIRFIAPVESMPGEFEMEALASGALAVLRGEEEAKTYDVLPTGYASWEQFYEMITNTR